MLGPSVCPIRLTGTARRPTDPRRQPRVPSAVLPITGRRRGYGGWSRRRSYNETLRSLLILDGIGISSAGSALFRLR
jgi:hypothetical protein